MSVPVVAATASQAKPTGAGTVAQAHRPKEHRLGQGRQELPQCRFGEQPALGHEFCPVLRAVDPGLRRLGIQRDHAVAGGRAHVPVPGGSQGFELVRERLALAVRSHHNQGHRGRGGRDGPRLSRGGCREARPRPRTAAGGSGAVSILRAMPATTASSNVRPTTVSPNWAPSTSPAGTATAHRSNRLQKFVYVPMREFTPTGSAATSARVGWNGAVGTTKASNPSSSAIDRRLSPLQPGGVRNISVCGHLAGATNDSGDRRIQPGRIV